MNIYVLNTLAIGEDLVDLVQRDITIGGVIGLSRREPGDAVSDYRYQADFCRDRGLDFIEIHSYDLRDGRDRAALLECDIDVLVVSGWQRLIPQWLIEHCSVCAIGSHGSPLGITRGRGRSPQNWALILGLERFEISIFEIDAGVDSGRIIDTRSFRYGPYDDIRTSYYKVAKLTAEMIVRAVGSPRFANRDFAAQSHKDAAYFPQRTPDDGAIDWGRSSGDVARFVRALTRPYPGAFSKLEGQRVRIWSAVPFDVDISPRGAPGTIETIFNKGELLVRCADGHVLVEDHEVEGGGRVGRGARFESVSFEAQMQLIIERHEARFPDQPLADEIRSFKRAAD